MDSAELDAIKLKHAALAGRKKLFVASLAGLILLVAAAAVSTGSFPVSATQIPAILCRAALGMAQSDPETATVVLILRLPRIAMGILAGIGLGVAGAVLQGVLRNPLASPTTIGISAAAGLGAAIALVLGVGPADGKYLLIANAFLFAMVPAVVIFALSRYRRTTPEVMILAGIGLLYIFGALTSLLQYVASDDALRSMVVWLMGDLGRAKWPEISVMCRMGMHPDITILRSRSSIIFDDPDHAVNVWAERLKLKPEQTPKLRDYFRERLQPLPTGKWTMGEVDGLRAVLWWRV